MAKKTTKKTDAKKSSVIASVATVARLTFSEPPNMGYDKDREACGTVDELELWPGDKLVATASCGDTAMVCSDKEARLALTEWLASTLGYKLVPIETT